MKFKIYEQENRQQQSQLLALLVAYMNNERPTNRGNSNEASLFVSQFVLEVESTAPRTPQQSDQPLTPSQTNIMDPEAPEPNSSTPSMSQQ